MYWGLYTLGTVPDADNSKLGGDQALAKLMPLVGWAGQTAHKKSKTAERNKIKLERCDEDNSNNAALRGQTWSFLPQKGNEVKW